MAKKPKTEAPDLDEMLPDDVLEAVPLIEPVPGEVIAPVPGKRSMGAKEPVPFKWKVLGNSGQVILTLFKSVEREEAEAQLERLRKDGYYTNLRIVDINEKVEQPGSKEAKKPAKAAKPEKSAKPEAPRKTRAAEKAGKAARAGKAEPSRKTAAKVEKTTAGKSKPASSKKGAGKTIAKRK